MNELDEIRKKLDDYTLDGYNVSNGWNKLQQRKGGGRYRLVRMIAGAAAACVIIVAGYWFLKEGSDERKHPNVTVSGIKIQKQTKPIIADTVMNSIKGVNEIRGLSALQKKSNNLIKHREREPVVIQELQGAKEKANDRNDLGVIREKNVNTENGAVVIVQKENQNSKPLEIVSEDQLLTMVSAVRETEPRQRKLKHFFISRGEQQEYTTEKYSSDPTNVKTINF